MVQQVERVERVVAGRVHARRDAVGEQAQHHRRAHRGSQIAGVASRPGDDRDALAVLRGTPRLSMRTEPMLPEACGGASIGNLAVSRSRRVADTHAAIREA